MHKNSVTHATSSVHDVLAAPVCKTRVAARRAQRNPSSCTGIPPPTTGMPPPTTIRAFTDEAQSIAKGSRRAQGLCGVTLSMQLEYPTLRKLDTQILYGGQIRPMIGGRRSTPRPRSNCMRAETHVYPPSGQALAWARAWLGLGLDLDIPL